jgi:hypothetical protein
MRETDKEGEQGEQFKEGKRQQGKGEGKEKVYGRY